MGLINVLNAKSVKFAHLVKRATSDTIADLINLFFGA